jgi:hypothetical protein
VGDEDPEMEALVAMNPIENRGIDETEKGKL